MSLTMDRIYKAMDAIISAREASLDEPTAIQGNRYTIYDFLFDTNARLEGATSDVRTLFGVRVIHDDEMPQGVIDIKSRDRVLRRLISLGGTWYACEVPEITEANPLGWD